MSGHVSSAGGRAGDGPPPEPDTPTAPTAVLPPSRDDAEASSPPAEPHARPSFRRRAALRRRARSLATRREAALRDLGGLVLELERAGRERPELVRERIAALRRLDDELAAIASELGGEPPPAGARPRACPSCGQVAGALDAYCPACGTDLRGGR